MTSLQTGLTYLYDFVLFSSGLFFAFHFCMTVLGQTSVQSQRDSSNPQTDVAEDAVAIAAEDTAVFQTDGVQQSSHPSTAPTQRANDWEQSVASETPVLIETASAQAGRRSPMTDHIVPFVRRCSPYQDWTRRQLLKEAKRVKLPGYSRMKTEALRMALTQCNRKPSSVNSSAAVA